MTVKFGMPDLANGQANYLNANEAFAMIDQLIGCAALDKDLSAPPGSPANGALYIVGASPTGAWAGKANNLAYWITAFGVWTFVAPREGLPVRVLDEHVTYEWNGTAWAVSSSGGSSGNMPQNSQSANYTLVLGDVGKHILHPSADTTARTFTIPANSSVAFNIGDMVTFLNQNGAGLITIAITTDTMRLAGSGATGSRTLAPNGIATAVKVSATEWLISGVGLT